MKQYRLETENITDDLLIHWCVDVNAKDGEDTLFAWAIWTKWNDRWSVTISNRTSDTMMSDLSVRADDEQHALDMLRSFMAVFNIQRVS